MKKKILSLFLAANMVLSSHAGWILTAAADTAKADDSNVLEVSEETEENSSDLFEIEGSETTQPPQDDASQPPQDNQTQTEQESELFASDVPFTAFIGEKTLQVNKIEDTICNATLQTVPVYQIVIPQGESAKTVSVSGLNGWGYIKNSCFGAADAVINQDRWEAPILTADQSYHLTKSSQNFHIVFMFLGEEIQPEEVPIPFTAKAGERELVVSEIENASQYVGCGPKHTYEITVPTALKEEIIDISGLEGFGYRAVRSEKSCWGRIESIESVLSVAVNEFGYHVSDFKGVSSNIEYKEFHIVFKTEESTQPPSAEMKAPFTAKIGETELAIEDGGKINCPQGNGFSEAEIQVYRIVVPENAQTFTYNGQDMEWGVNSCTQKSEWWGNGDSVKILGENEYYHVENGSTVFHITFRKSNEVTPEVPQPPIVEMKAPFTAKIGETELEIEDGGKINCPQGNGFSEAEIQVYRIVVPENAQTFTYSGKYMNVGENNCKSFSGSWFDGSTVKILGENEYYHLKNGSTVFHVTFRKENTVQPQPQPQPQEPQEGSIELPSYIFSEKWNAEYDVLYYEKDKAYSYNGKKVTFSDGSILIGEEAKLIKNKAVVPNIVTQNGKTEITFDGLQTPVGGISGEWNSGFGGKFAINYSLHNQPIEKTVTDRISTVKLIVDTPTAGTYTLTDGSIYEAANEYSGGHDFGDGKGVVTERNFGYLPQLVFTVGESENPPLPQEETFPPMPQADASIPDDFDNDLWLQYDFKEMKVGETADIYPRRVPQLIDSVIANNVTRPIFRYEIIFGDSITLSALSGREKVGVTAVKNGLTIVKVTYDEQDGAGACSRVNTAYVVYDVNDSPANITITSSASKWRSYDTVYFTEGSSVDFPLTVQAPGAEKLEVTCNGNILAENGQGEYVAALENKSNIIGIKATDAQGKTKTRYQVLDARKAEIKIENINDPKAPIVNHGEAFNVGDKIRISFKGITMPVYKLATIYNPCFGGHDSLNNKDTWPTSVVYHNDKLGDKDGEVHGFCNQWDLARKNAIEITLSEEGVFDFTNGHIACNWWGSPLGADKDVYGKGDPNFAAPILSDNFSTIPSFSVRVGKSDSVSNVEKLIAEIGNVTLEKEEAIVNARKAYAALSEGEQGKVSNYSVLVEAEKKLNELKDETNAKKVNAVIEQIAKIGEVTLQSEAKIKAAREAYHNLPKELQDKVTNIKDLEKAEKRLEELKQSEEESEKKVADVKAKINAIDKTVTLDSEKAIREARDAYEALTDAQKKQITPREYKKLTDAENTLKDLIAAKMVDDKIAAIGTVTANSKIAIQNARAAYDHLTAEQKRLVKNLHILLSAEKRLAELTNQNKPHANHNGGHGNRVDRVVDLIDRIGTVTVNSESQIKTARNFYNQLSAAEKAKVFNIQKLLDAERELSLLKMQGDAQAGKVIEQIKALGTTITLQSESKIKAARRAYNALSPQQKKMVSNLQTLVAAENALNQLKLQKNYTSAQAFATQPKATSAQITNAGSANLNNSSAHLANSISSTLSYSGLNGGTADFNSMLSQMPLDKDGMSTMAELTLVDMIEKYLNMSDAEKSEVDGNRLQLSMMALAEYNQTDERSGISVSNTEWFVKLQVASAPNFQVLKNIQQYVGESQVLGLWDISLRNIMTGEEYIPNDMVQISIPLNGMDGSNLCIVHYDDNGNMEYIQPQVLGDSVLFETGEFSSYAIVRYEEGQSPFDLNRQLAGTFANDDHTSFKAGGVSWVVPMVLVLQLIMIAGVVVLAVFMVKVYNKSKKREEK